MEAKSKSKKQNKTERNEGKIVSQYIPTYTDEEKREIILLNVSKMLAYRKKIDDRNITAFHQDLLKSGTDDLVYKATGVNKTSTEIKGTTTYAVKIYPQKVSSLGSATGVSDFLQENADAHKFVVVSEMTEAAYNEITKSANVTEVFYIDDLMFCIAEHELVPPLIVLSPEETKEFLRTYNCTKKQLGRIESSDPQARFYGLQPGDIVRLILPSEIAGYSSSYKIISKATLFPKK